jgi:hypothetical protein
MPNWLPFVLILLIPCIPLLFIVLRTRLVCEECKTPVPRFIRPWTRRWKELLDGGWTCQQCGSCLNRLGEVIDPDEPPSQFGIRTAIFTLIFIALTQVASFVVVLMGLPRGPAFRGAPPPPPVAVPIAVAPQAAPEP